MSRPSQSPDAALSPEQVRAEARRQWSHDPAGARDAGPEPLGSPASFARVEAARYEEQGWMDETFRFERFAGARVLEIGVGLGTDHVQLARNGARLSGIDLTPRCVDLTRSRLEQEGHEPDVRVMDAEDLDFPDDSFDVVYSFGVLHHVPSTERAFAEVRRVLRPGGAFVGALYSRESLAYARLVFAWVLSGRFLTLPHDEMLSGFEFGDSGALPHVRLFTLEELRGLLHTSGFQRVALKRRHAGLGRLTPYVPTPVERALGRAAGWYLVHEAT